MEALHLLRKRKTGAEGDFFLGAPDPQSFF